MKATIRILMARILQKTVLGFVINDDYSAGWIYGKDWFISFER